MAPWEGRENARPFPLALEDSSPSGWWGEFEDPPPSLTQIRGSLEGWGWNQLSPEILVGINESWQHLCSNNANSGCLLPFSSYKTALEEVFKKSSKGSGLGFRSLGPGDWCDGCRATCLDLKQAITWMWELDYKESWVLKNWCFWTVVL